MRAIVCTDLIGPEGLRLQDVPTPEPGACHVRIRVRAAGVNFADTLMIQGRYQERLQPPFVPGLELAGEIEAVGAGAVGLEQGQRVLALVDRGAFAEHAVATMDDVIPIPPELDDVTAAGFAIAYGTAYGALTWRASLHAGETLLVHGAAGGVGLTAVECGKALGARVLATARGRDRLEIARQHGADLLFDSESPDLVEQIREATGGQGVDVVFDPVGGPMFDASLRVVAWEGRILLIGFASGTIPQIPANRLLVKNASAVGFYWGSYRRRDPGRLREAFDVLIDWYRAGVIRPHVSTVLDLAEGPEALRLIAGRRSSGKIVLRA
jgi:NADPH:quinone reductase